jgi:hypothetical protein
MIRALIPSLILAGLAAFALTAGKADDQTKNPQHVFELRTYYTNEGKIDALHKRFREHTDRLFKRHGIHVVGYWVPHDEKDKLVYLVRFSSRDAAKAAWKEFSDDPEWQKVFKESHKDGVIVKKVESVFMDPTDYSSLK